MGEKEPLNIIITGVGGQGNVLLSQLVGKVLVRAGFHATIGETYGASQRGGAVMSHLRVSRKMQYGPLIGEGQADVIVGLEPLETLRVIAQYGNPGVAVITNSRPVFPLAVSSGGAKYPTVEEIAETIKELSSRSWVVDATEIALKQEAARETSEPCASLKKGRVRLAAIDDFSDLRSPKHRRTNDRESRPNEDAIVYAGVMTEDESRKTRRRRPP